MQGEDINVNMKLSIDGLGIVFYSDGAISTIEPGCDFLTNEYWEPEKVAEHISKGDIVGFATGGGGDYELRFRSGYPSRDIEESFPASIRLGIEVIGDKINVIDLYWLMEWEESCPEEQQLNIEPGFYHITLQGEKPIWAVRDMLSDKEHDEYIDRDIIIYVYLNRVAEMPKLKYSGVPSLYWAFEET